MTCAGAGKTFGAARGGASMAAIGPVGPAVP